MERPDWLDPVLFPFESRFLDVDGATVHHVDEGTGPPLLLLHGNPTWSFLYREVIAGLRDRFRCVAPDYPGFGLSRPAPGYGFTPAEHAEVVRRLVLELDLRDVTLMVQDWGGPIGPRSGHADARALLRPRRREHGGRGRSPISRPRGSRGGSAARWAAG